MMAYNNINKFQSNVWYLDNGCNNYMCVEKSKFFESDESFRNTVAFDDKSKVSVIGNGSTKIITKENTNQASLMSIMFQI